MFCEARIWIVRTVHHVGISREYPRMADEIRRMKIELTNYLSNNEEIVPGSAPG